MEFSSVTRDKIKIRVNTNGVRVTGNSPERISGKELRCGFVLYHLTEVTAILSVRPLNQWHAPITMTG